MARLPSSFIRREHRKLLSPTCREEDILQDLPPRLHAEVKAHANKETVRLLQNHYLFEGLDDNILTKLVVSLRYQYLPPDELVCVEGEVGRHTYIIRKGVCQVGIVCILVSSHPTSSYLHKGLLSCRGQDMCVEQCNPIDS